MKVKEVGGLRVSVKDEDSKSLFKFSTNAKGKDFEKVDHVNPKRRFGEVVVEHGFTGRRSSSSFKTRCGSSLLCLSPSGRGGP